MFYAYSGSENETSPVVKKPELGPWFMETDVPILKALVLHQFDIHAFNFDSNADFQENLWCTTILLNTFLSYTTGTISLFSMLASDSVLKCKAL